ncbi:hypothetical protein CY34DRAFT_88736 [Suillus luteus UH-Slu-Lm8-n1]|uniref:Unplaced genomic scaffold CY34scaffold_200, whole genome shotgun sequence n=1 Tax=Suillus luteus UH-Slu-Lm8-n1 TaxID=930992 RepID=A0A0D0AZF1_9AGAM|nr:hypothetical protein CY34DRAFT_88736 [Suillus luteus UH-Slu-Lm8-n1]
MDPLAWWHGHRKTYPRLSRMAIGYLTIPAMFINVECIFSRGQLLLSHVRSRLSAQSTRALLHVGLWSQLGLVKDTDILSVSSLPDVNDEDVVLDDRWDSIILE